MIRILVVGDSFGVSRGLQLRLAAEPDLAVIGTATDSQAALGLAMSLQPDVVVLDLDTPPVDGLGTVCAVRDACPGVSIVVLSLQDDILSRHLAECAGADAFVPKSMPDVSLLEAIRALGKHRAPVGGQTASSAD
jgi:DNA-binding NarL/FixJ family response regulator